MMDRPYIICHMVTSIDGKVTGDFLGMPSCEKATEIYYDLKLADLRHNSDLTRLDHVDAKAIERVEKYKKAMALLESSR